MLRKKIVLACHKCSNRNYSTQKETSREGRLEVRKFCKNCGEHTLHRETK